MKAKKKDEVKNHLYYGDNLEVLRNYLEDNSIDLCYIDPPFNSNRSYNQIYNNIEEVDKAQAQAFIDTWSWDVTANDGYTQIIENSRGLFPRQTIELIMALKEKVLRESDLMAYLISITLRVGEIRRVLKQTGSFYFHCDPTASHYLKIVLDTLFCSGKGDFKNEIIWHYKKWSTKQKQFVSNHDVIFFYTKSEDKNRVFNQLFMPRAASTLKRFGTAKIISGHDAEGNRLPSETSEEESEGVAMDDVWDIGRVPPVKQLYPTQKPDALLERIITASTNKGDIVLDAYCGCGTTVMAAEKLHRNWVGIDITYQSISLILRRLEEGYGKPMVQSINVTGMPFDFESAVALANKHDDRTRKEFEKWIVLTYSNNKAHINEKKGGDGGIDGISYLFDTDSTGKREPKSIIFSVKSSKKLSPTVLRDLNGTLDKEQAAMGILLTLYPMPNLVKESKKYGVYTHNSTGKKYPKIEVFCVEDILKGKRMELQIVAEVLKKSEVKKDNKNQNKLF